MMNAGVIIIIPTLTEGAVVLEDTSMVDMVSISERQQLKPDQVSRQASMPCTCLALTYQ